MQAAKPSGALALAQAQGLGVPERKIPVHGAAWGRTWGLAWGPSKLSKQNPHGASDAVPADYAYSPGHFKGRTANKLHTS